MSQRGHAATVRSSQKPSATRRSFYIFATCKRCGKNGKTTSTDGIRWTFSAIEDCATSESCAPTACVPCTSFTMDQPLVECNVCLSDTRSFVSCAARHHICGECFETATLSFNFSDRQKCLTKKQIVAPDLHSWPFMCYNCVEQSVCNLYPIGTCMSLLSSECTRILFNTLRKFKLDEGENFTQEVSDPSEVETVRRMVELRCDPKLLDIF
jgi:hypothetical protein